MPKIEKLGKYQIGKELGRGAMGVVYEAFDPLIERTVAIKTILKSAIDKGEAEETFSRFRREARAAGRLSHPKIVSIYEYGEDDEMAFIVMELIRGKELKEYFDHEDRFSIKDGIRIVMQILDALDYSHSRSVVHRDIKPANILITDSGQIKIADFGIAKIDSSLLTQAGVVLGTPTYMSPEQFMGHAVDHRADLYATGVILYQFLTGARPFNGSVITIMHQAVNQEAVPPSQLNPAVSKQLDEVVKKAMAKKPEDRFQNATEFMSALKTAAQTSPLPSVPERNPDITWNDIPKTLRNDDTIILPKGVSARDTRRQADIEAWQRITNSQDVQEFERYLQDFPQGEFAELAQMRITSLAKLAEQARALEQENQRKQAARLRAELDEKNKRAAEQQRAIELARAEAQQLAQIEAKRKHEAEEKTRLARQIEEIKITAAAQRALAEAKREQENIAQSQRALSLAQSITERAGKFTEIVSERELSTQTERKMKMEIKRQLEEEAQRKKQGKQALLSKRASAEAQADAAAEEEKQREAAAQLAHENELAEAHAKAETAERLKREAETRAALAHQRTRFWIVTVGTVLAALLVGILVMLFFTRQ